MKLFSGYTVLLIATTLLFSCDSHVDCPEFDQELLEWLPYSNGDSFSLKNSSTDSVLNFTVNSMIVNHTVYYDPKLDCGKCDDFIGINEYTEHENNLHASIYLNSNSFNTEYYFIKGQEFSSINSNITEFANYSFSGNVYDKVRIAERFNSTDTFKSLIIARGIGIIGLLENNGDEWKLIPVSKKTSQKISVPINKIYCE